MIRLIAAVSFILAASIAMQAQGMGHPEGGPLKKIEELEKVKLIETLGMDEQTTLKFFARRTKYREEQTQLIKNIITLTDQMNDLTKKNDVKNNEEVKKMIGQYEDLENRILKQKQDFYNSLSDILTYNQIAKVIVFERKFREEIRAVLFQQRRKGRP
jgi:ABC-type nitrate/sulfonate/bicarbonate transport system substrate-binding protein